MTEWLKKLVRNVYGLRNGNDNEMGDGALVVALDYGLTVTNGLPIIEKTVLAEAARIARERHGRLAWASANFLFPHSETIGDAMKYLFLKRKGMWGGDVIAPSGVTNSVTEAYAIRHEVERRGLRPGTVVVVLHWLHARSVCRIWKKAFPDARIVIRSMETPYWEGLNRVKMLQSENTWLFACLARHLALLLLGPDRIIGIREPVT